MNNGSFALLLSAVVLIVAVATLGYVLSGNAERSDERQARCVQQGGVLVQTVRGGYACVVRIPEQLSDAR